MKHPYGLFFFRNMIPAIVFFILIMLFPIGVVATTPATGPLNPGQGDRPPDIIKEAVQAQIYALPLSFVPYSGQVDSEVAFTVTGRQSTLFFTQDAVVIIARDGEADPSAEHVIRQTFPGSAANPVIEGEDPRPGVTNYIIGNDPSRWKSNVPTYGSIIYRDLYPGIDLRYKGTEGTLKREFIVAPSANPSVIRLRYDGVDTIAVDETGAMHISAGNSTLTESPPVCYQEIGSEDVSVSAVYGVLSDHDVTYALGPYDPAFPLVIDPPLIYSTYLGGISQEYGNSIAVDSSGNAYVTGNTYSSDFPTTLGAYNQTYGGGGNSDAFVTKLAPDGSTLVYSTYLGGSEDDQGLSIAVDSDGTAHVIGYTYSSDFPTTWGAFNQTKGGSSDVFVISLNQAGSGLVYSTFLGGSDKDDGSGIAVDSWGNAYVAGETDSPDFPTSPGAYNRTYGGSTDVFLSKLDYVGNVVYSTFMGGAGQDNGKSIAFDNSGNTYVTGYTSSSDFPTTPGAYNQTYGGGGNSDAFVTKLNPLGSSLVYSTLLGAAGNDRSNGIAVDNSGNAYVIGYTGSSNFPTTIGAYNRAYSGGYSDAFVTKLNWAGSSLLYSTYLGGADEDYGRSIAVDSRGNAYVTAETYSSNFPTTIGAYNRTKGGSFDAFVTKLNPAGSSLLYSTYLGGAGEDVGVGITVDSHGNAYVTGSTESSDFPTTGDAYDTVFNTICDTFVTKFYLTGSDIGVFRSGQWILDYGIDGTVNSRFYYGLPTDTPFVGDINNDGTMDIGVFRSGQWILDYAMDGTVDRRFYYGLPTDTPLVGDFNNDGTMDIGVFRSGQWILDYGIDGTVDRRFYYGLPTDISLLGDFNNDGTTDIGVFRSGQWILDYGIDGTVDRRFYYGLPTDTPLVGDFNNEGITDIGAFRSGQWILDYGMDWIVDRRFNYGLPTDIPIVGKWI
jgi:hypothetical protein